MNNKAKKNSILLYTLIVIGSLLLMVIIYIAQVKASKSITHLKEGNALTSNSFIFRNNLGQIINGVFYLDNAANNDDAYKIISYKVLDSLTNGIKKQLDEIQTITTTEIKVKNDLINLRFLINKKLNLYTINPFDSNFKNIFNDFETAKESLLLTDSIYALDLKIQESVQDKLKATVLNAENSSKNVLSFSNVLGIFSITLLIILVTFILKKLISSNKLIDQLHQANEKIEKNANIKEQFLANMSHEIRTPTNSIIGFSNLLQKSNLAKEQKELAQFINTSGKNLLHIINDILDISKIDAGMLQINKSQFKVKELCHTTEMMFQQLSKDKSIQFNCNVNDKVPDIVIGDEVRLNQVITNLISNAIKFTQHGSIALRVDVKKQMGNEVILSFTVKDTGIGIPKNKLATIFERFEQAESDTTRKYGGTGLGLSIVKDLVKLQNGTIEVSSILNEGSEFVCTIPFETIYEKMGNNILSINQESNTLDNKLLNKMKVLVVEDNIMNQTLLKYILVQWGVSFEFANNGIVALDMIKNNLYDIILMDIQMPELDGYQTTKIIREKISSSIPIIAMTANALPQEKAKCINIGMNNYISKPLEEKLLFDLLAQYSNKIIKENVLASNKYIDKSYLKDGLDNNQSFINEIVAIFLDQYPSELLELQNAIENKNLIEINRLGHHMKSTVTALHQQSSLFPYFQFFENAKGDNNWVEINKKLNELLDSKESVLTSVKSCTSQMV